MKSNRASLHRGILFSVCVALSSLACTNEIASEEIGTVQEELNPFWAKGRSNGNHYVWNQGDPTAGITLDGEATSFCVLTKVKGDFSGYGEKIEVVPVQNWFGGATWWVLRGQSQQSGVGGEAHCFAKNQFLANGPERWNWGWSVRTSGSSANVAAWGGHAATFLSGVSGKFQGGAERVRVTQSTSPGTPSRVYAEGQQGAMEAKAQSYFVGAQGTTQPAKFWGAGTFTQSCTGGESGCASEVAMAPTDAAMCGFTYIGGDFGGGAETVEIYPKIYPQLNVEYWYLKVTTGSGCRTVGCINFGSSERYIRADAKCYMRDQR